MSKRKEWRTVCLSGCETHTSVFKRKKDAVTAGRHSRRYHGANVMVESRTVTDWQGTAVSVLDGERGGATFNHDLDYARLNAQHKRVYHAIKSGDWFTLGQISDTTGDPEASISARLRDFRKYEFGGHELEADRSAESSGLWLYRLIWRKGVPKPEDNE